MSEERQQGQRQLLKKVGIALLVVAGGLAAGAYLYFSQLPFYPVARIATADQVTYTAFSDEVSGREACEAANARFVEPLRESCPACSVAFTRCERKAEVIALRLEQTTDGPPLIVSFPGMQIAVSGPPALARATCEFMAGDLARQGVKGPRCVTSTLSNTGSRP